MRSTIKYLWQLSRKHRPELFWVVLLGLLNVAFSLYFIWVSKELVDIATTHQGAFWPKVVELGIVMLLRILIMGIRQFLVNHSDIKLTNSIRQRLFSQAMNAPWRGREDMAVGDVMSRLGEDVRVVVSCLTSDMPQLVLSICQLLAASWFLFVLQPALLWAVLAITPVALLMSKIFYKTTRRLTQKIREEEADINSHLQESLLNRAMLISLQRVSLMIERLMGKQGQLYDTYKRRIAFTVQARLFIHFTFMAGYAASFVWGAHGIMLGTVTYGMMTAFLQLVAQVQGPMLTLSELLPKMVQSTTAADRLRALSNNAEDIAVDSVLSNTEKNTPSSPQDITLQNISFRYIDGEKYILKDLSLTLPAGSATAIVGPTGSGKSTLVRLLLGLLKPTKGSINTGNQRIAYVPQGNSLLRGTIRDNLQLGKLDATEEEMREALRRASALFVYDLPQGLDTPCGEKGSGLSEGQAQRIAIARALLQPGTVMILDEASSALDPQTERQILEEIQHTQTGKTLIWVTHHEVVKEYMTHVVEVR